ncbi:hypothetical protein quinque_014406 [Culex quinquefasciatus]
MKVPLVVLILAGLLTVGVSGSEVFESEVDHASSNDHPQSIGRNRILPELAKKPAAGSETGSDKDIIPLIDQEDQEDQKEGQLFAGDRGQFSVVDRVLLALLRDALGSLEGSRCRRDMNWTLDAIERKEPWAVAMEISELTNRVLKSLSGKVALQVIHRLSVKTRRPRGFNLFVVDGEQAFDEIYATICSKLYNFAGYYVVIVLGNDYADEQLIAYRILQQMWRFYVVNINILFARVSTLTQLINGHYPIYLIPSEVYVFDNMPELQQQIRIIPSANIPQYDNAIRWGQLRGSRVSNYEKVLYDNSKFSDGRYFRMVRQRLYNYALSVAMRINSCLTKPFDDTILEVNANGLVQAWVKVY